MKQKGFTLIELLAVIVILAIIAVITVPMIMNVIDKAKIGALEDSAYGMVESANLWYAENSKDGISDTKFTIENNVQISDNTDVTTLLSYKGTIDKGYVSILSNGKVAVCVDNKANKVEIGYNDTKITTSNGICDGLFTNTVNSSIDEEVSITTINELQNRISTVEGDISDLKGQVSNLNSSINDLNSGFGDLIITNSFSIGSKYFPAIGTQYLTGKAPTIDGYKFLFIIPENAGNSDMVWVKCSSDAVGNISLAIRNVYNNNFTLTPTVKGVYIRTFD